MTGLEMRRMVMGQMAGHAMKKLGTYTFQSYVQGNCNTIIQQVMQDGQLSNSAVTYILMINNTLSEEYAGNAIVFSTRATLISEIEDSGKSLGYAIRNNYNTFIYLASMVKIGAGSTCEIYRVDQ